VNRSDGAVRVRNSIVRARSSIVRARSSIVRVRSSIVRALSSIVRALSSIVRALRSIVRAQSSIVRARSSIVRARSSIVRALSSIVRALSSIVRALSSIVRVPTSTGMYERRMSRLHTYFWGGKVKAQGGAGGRRRDACATPEVVAQNGFNTGSPLIRSKSPTLRVTSVQFSSKAHAAIRASGNLIR
jgi:hypothetical protein